MAESDEEILEGMGDDFDFDPDNLDPNALDEEEEFIIRKSTSAGNVPVFLARLQWWGFGILLAFILIVILRMIFGPPWIDRFRFPRPPVAIDQARGIVGAIVPLEDNYYTLFFVDTSGQIISQKKLGKFLEHGRGPLDFVMGKDHYYFLFGAGRWIAVRPYATTDDLENRDIELGPFGLKYRDGIDMIYSETGEEYLNVFTNDTIITLKHEEPFWTRQYKYTTSDWGEPDWQITDLSRNYALVASGTAFLFVDFPDFIDGYKKYNAATFTQFIQPRPQYQMEFFKPGWIITSKDQSYDHEYLLLKNDRMFNLTYKYSDDQVLGKAVGEKDMVTLNHPFFAGKDVRGITIISGESKKSSAGENNAELAIIYEMNSVFYLAGLSWDASEPVWDLKLGASWGKV